MDQRLLNWILARHERLNENGKKYFMYLLEFGQNDLAVIISQCLPYWSKKASAQLGIIFGSVGSNQETREVLRAFQRHFKKEMHKSASIISFQREQSAPAN